MIALDGNAALRMAIVDRSSMSALDQDWDAPGIYLLLDPVQLDGSYGVYVGKAPAGLRGRACGRTAGTRSTGPAR